MESAGVVMQDFPLKLLDIFAHLASFYDFEQAVYAI